MKLYSAPGTCATAINIVLEWIDADYEVEHLNLQAMKEPEYLKLNPMGVVPTLVIDDVPYNEAAAILTHLVDMKPEKNIGPSIGEPRRADLYRWLSSIGGTLHPYFWPHFVPFRFTTDKDGHDAVREASHTLIDKAFRLIDEHLGDNRYMLGDERSVVDAFLYPMASWGYGLPKPTSDYQNIHRLLVELASDTGVQRVHELQGTAPKASA